MNNPFEAWNDFHLRQMQKIAELMKLKPVFKTEPGEEPNLFECAACHADYTDDDFEREALEDWGVCTKCDHILGSLRS